MLSRIFITSLIMFTSITAQAEFTDNSYLCFDNNDNFAFQMGEYQQRGGFGQELSKYDRTDFNVDFATYLKSRNLFGFRTTGPVYTEHRNTVYENNHRTLVNGNGFKGEFLFVFKPYENEVKLEIWKWGNRPHFGHVTLPGDTLVFNETFYCE